MGRRMNCGNCVRYGMFIANILIFLGGATVFGIGLWALIDTSYLNELLGKNLYIGAIYALVITSALVCVLAILGCVGSVRQVKCMLLTYCILLFLVFVTMLIGGILAFVFREKVEPTMKQEMMSTLKFYGSREVITRAWDSTQERFKCCGVESYSNWFGRHSESCCKEEFNGSRLQCQSYDTFLNIQSEGCLEKVTKYVHANAAIIGGAGIFVAFLMILGMIFSCMLFKTIE